MGDARGGEIHEEGAIAIPAAIIPGAALIHVDEMHAIAWLEPEVLVLLVRLRTPALSKRIGNSSIIIDGTVQQVLHTLKQVIVRSRLGVDQWLEILGAEKVAANVVNSGGLSRGAGDGIPSFRKSPSPVHHRMVEIFHNQIFNQALLHRPTAGAHIDGHPVADAIDTHQQFGMRVLIIITLIGNGRAFEHTIVLHGWSPEDPKRTRKRDLPVVLAITDPHAWQPLRAVANRQRSTPGATGNPLAMMSFNFMPSAAPARPSGL